MMPEEPINPSEERLRRHAQERRAQGGEFALHPATRRMLQGEVARTLGAQAAAKPRGFLAWLNSWNARLALGATAAVVVGGAVIWWNNRPNEQPMHMAFASAPATEKLLAGSEGTRGFSAADKDVALVAAPSAQPELEVMKRESADAPRPAANTLNLAAVDRLDTKVLAQNGRQLFYKAQAVTNSVQATEASGTLAPTSFGYAIPAAQMEAVKQNAGQQLAVNYANAGGQNVQAGQAGVSFADTYQNQAASGGAQAGRATSATFGTDASKALAENSDAGKFQNAPAVTLLNDEAKVAETRARALRPVAAPARPAEEQARGAATLAQNAPASEAATPPAKSETPSRFYRVNETANAERSRSKASASAAAPVLNNFVIEQRSNTVRVIDGDGSVYEGAIETAPLPSSGPGALQELVLDTKTETAPRHQELSFRAAGSNVTLRQTVVVNGRFSPEPAAAATASKLQTSLAGRRSAAPSASTFSGEYDTATNTAPTIEGTVRIGTTNQQWFRAYRRAP